MDSHIGGLLDNVKRVIRAKFYRSSEIEDSTHLLTTNTHAQDHIRLSLGDFTHHLHGSIYGSRHSQENMGIDQESRTYNTKLVPFGSPSSAPTSNVGITQGAPAIQGECAPKIPLWNNAPRSTAPLLKNGGEIAMAKRGNQLSLALFLSPSLIADVANVVDRMREFGPLEEEYERAEGEIEKIQDYLDSSDEFIEDAVDECRRQEIISRIKQRQKDLDLQREWKRGVQRDYRWQKSALKMECETLARNLAILLREEGLMSSEDEAPHSCTEQNTDYADLAPKEYEYGDDRSDVVEDAPEPEEKAARYAALNRWQNARSKLCAAYRDFEGRDVIEHNQLREFNQRLAAGESNAGPPEGGWDLFFCHQYSQLTRDLINAEEEEKQALAEVFAHGGPPSEAGSALSSNFPEYPDDGYTLSFEEEMTTKVNRDGIEGWIDSILDPIVGSPGKRKASDSQPVSASTARARMDEGISAMPAASFDEPNSNAQLVVEEDQIPMDIDDWTISSLGFGEGLSAKYPVSGKEHERIARWQAMCEEIRCQFAFLQHTDDGS